MKPAGLTQEQFDRADRALAAVIDEPGSFTDNEVDFALRNAERLGRYRLNIWFSPAQWKFITDIERKIEEAS